MTQSASSLRSAQFSGPLRCNRVGPYSEIEQPEQDRVAEICCTLEDADKLVVLASAIYPDAVEYIKRAIVASLSSD
jgi:hypothetical protein